jgi:hypothetical protein
MNVETIYAKKSFLGLAFPVKLRNAEFLQSISRQITVQEIALFFIFLFSRSIILLKRDLIVEELVCGNESLSLLFLIDSHGLSSGLVFSESIRIQHLHFGLKCHV